MPLTHEAVRELTPVVRSISGVVNPIEAMSLGSTLRARSLTTAVGRGEVERGVHPVLDAVDRGVAEAFLAVRTAS